MAGNGRLVVDLRSLLAAAADGDPDAWQRIVDQHSGLLWSIARGFRLNTADAGDAVQLTWLRLVENLDTIQEPDRLAAWLATTVRRECLQLIRRGARTQPVADLDRLGRAEPGPAADDGLLRREQAVTLWRTFARLGESCQRLLRVLMATPPPAYLEVAAALDMPIGSIGPTRQRCLARLRELVAEDAVLDPAEGHRS